LKKLLFHFFIIFTNHSKKLAHNVLGKRRLGQVIGQCEALTPAPNVAEQKRIKGE
jgi:hypothetical protein